MPRRDSAALPAAAQEQAWSALWQRLLQLVPGDSPEAELHKGPEDEATEEDSASTSSASALVQGEGPVATEARRTEQQPVSAA